MRAETYLDDLRDEVNYLGTYVQQVTAEVNRMTAALTAMGEEDTTDRAVLAA